MFWFDASFGDFPLRIASISTEDGRDIVVQTPARGNKHYNQDRGAKVGRVSAELIFVDEPRAADFRDRFDAFRKLISDGEPKIFSHPLLGAYLARCEGGTHNADAKRMISWSVSFLPESEPQVTSQALAGTTPLAGVQALEVSAQEANDAIAAVGLSSPAPANTLARVTAWNEADELDSQDVIVGVESAVAEINQAIDDLEMSSQIERWQAYQAFVQLAYVTRRVADSFTSSSERATPLTVAAPTPLLTICARVYGASRATDMADVVARRNRIRNPGLIATGTVLTMPGV